MTPPLEEPRLPELPRRFLRPLAALWVSLAVHAALLLFVQVAPSGGQVGNGAVLQARLEPVQAPVETPPAPEPDAPPQPSGTLTPTEVAGSAPAAQLPPLPAPPPPKAFPPPAPPAEPDRPAFGIDAGVDLTYYTARELDKQAVPRRDIEFAYPVEADRTQVSGSVRVQLKIEADGRISNMEVIESTPPGVFDASALEAFGTLLFEPAQKNGRPVRALMLIEVTYDWAGRSHGER